MSDILDRIEQALGCQQCQGPLGGSPSDDFCGEKCATAWRAERVGAEAPPDEWHDLVWASGCPGCEFGQTVDTLPLTIGNAISYRVEVIL